jgi:glycopeptide antibiotics resistance protein
MIKNLNKIFIAVFYIANLVLIILYLFPGSIFGCLFYDDCLIQPKITSNIIISSNFFISSNHLYAFILLSVLGFFAYRNTKKIKFLIIYLFSLSIILELFHILIPIRTFEWEDLIGNILGIILAIIVYKIKDKYVHN